MTRAELLDRFARVRTGTSDGRPALHKPLLLLLALGRVAQGRRRLVSFASAEPQWHRLLKEFGPARQAAHLVYPFGRLRADKLWEIPGDAELATTASGDLHAKQLRDRGIVGGFPEPVHDLLASDPELVVAAAEMLLAEHFPSSDRDAVRDACGLRWDWSLVQPQPKDPQEAAFRTRVLTEYRNRCSICDFDARVNNRVFALEAARIQWPSHGGPNEIVNALALCLLHHKALNHGALGLQHEGEGYRVLVSRNVAGSSPAAARLMALQGTRVRQPLTPALAPLPSFVTWHRNWVFQAPARLERTG